MIPLMMHLNELGETDYTREEIQLMRIKFMSELGNKIRQTEN